MAGNTPEGGLKVGMIVCKMAILDMPTFKRPYKS